jgi:hypothetical protein
MPELERDLRELGRALELPPAPDLAARVAGRLQARPPAWRRWALAAALAALALGVAFAVPPARSALLRLFHLGGATIVRVETLPPAQERGLAADLGLPADPARGVERLGGRALLPPGTKRVYLGAGMVSVLLDGPVLLSEFPGDDRGFLKKFASGGASVEGADVGGFPGLWIQGRHVVAFSQVPARYAGNVLIGQRAGLTLRLEGPHLTRGQAMRIAAALRDITH